MSTFPRPITPTNNLTDWLKKLQLWVQSISPRNSDDITVTRTTNGTVFTLNERYKTGQTFYYDRLRAYKNGDNTTTTDVAEWSPILPYSIGDVVRVTKTYHAGYEKSEGVYDTTKPIYIVPCWAVCVSDVPDKRLLSAEVQASKIGLSNSGQYNIEKYYRRENICYGPLSYEWEPYILNSYFTTPATSGDIRAEQGRFWEVISLIPTKMKVCVDGSEQDILIEGTTLPSSVDDADDEIDGPGLVVTSTD